MKQWQKIVLVISHFLVLVLFCIILVNGVQLRWRLGYVIFWLTAFTGIGLYLIRNIIAKIYSVCWIGLSILVIIVTVITYDSVYCETDKYIMKEPCEIIGFDSAILYEKKGLLEVEKMRYKFVYPKSMIPLDSIGAIVVYGDFYNGETTEDGVSILPFDDSFNKEKAKEYALNHNIEYGE